MMVFLLIVVVTLLLLAPALLKQNPQLLGATRVVLSVVAIALLTLRFTTCSNAPLPPGEESYNRYWAVGWKIGDLMAEAHPDGGSVYVLQALPESDGMRTINDSQLAGLKNGAGRTEFEFVTRTPGGTSLDPGSDPDEAQLSLADVLEECEGAEAVVSFVALPRDLPAQFPTAYVLDDFSTGYWLSAMERGLVAGAVTPHLDPGDFDYAKERGSPAERFDAFFRLFTPHNMESFN